MKILKVRKKKGAVHSPASLVKCHQAEPLPVHMSAMCRESGHMVAPYELKISKIYSNSKGLDFLITSTNLLIHTREENFQYCYRNRVQP